MSCFFAFVTYHMTDVFLVGVVGAFLKLLPLAVLMFLLWTFIGPVSLVLMFRASDLAKVSFCANAVVAILGFSL